MHNRPGATGAPWRDLGDRGRTQHRQQKQTLHPEHSSKGTPGQVVDAVWWKYDTATGGARARNRHAGRGQSRVVRPAFEVVFEAEFPALHRYLSRRVGVSKAEISPQRLSRPRTQIGRSWTRRD